MHWLMELQRWLYGGMLGGMKSTVDLAGLPALMGAAFVFGIAHALTPGHGKSILVSYHLSQPSRLIEGVATGTLLALTHVGRDPCLVQHRGDQQGIRLRRQGTPIRGSQRRAHLLHRPLSSHSDDLAAAARA
jgi:hypothetical protein